MSTLTRLCTAGAEGVPDVEDRTLLAAAYTSLSLFCSSTALVSQALVNDTHAAHART